MIAKSYQLAILNSSGVEIPAEMIDLLYEERFLSESYENGFKSQKVALENVAALANSVSVVLGSAQANDQNPIELEGVLKIQFGGLTPNGTIALYYLPSGDGGTTFPDIENGFEVLQFTITTGGTHKIGFYI